MKQTNYIKRNSRGRFRTSYLPVIALVVTIPIAAGIIFTHQEVLGFLDRFDAEVVEYVKPVSLNCTDAEKIHTAECRKRLTDRIADSGAMLHDASSTLDKALKHYEEVEEMYQRDIENYNKVYGAI